MLPAEGFPNTGSLPYPDDVSPSVTMNLPLIPLSNMITEGYDPNFMAFEYTAQTPVMQQSPHMRNRRSPPSQKSKTQPSPTEQVRNVGHDPRMLAQNGQTHPP